jgi:hypothetical protein
MNSKRDCSRSRRVTGHDLIVATIGVVYLFGPMILLLVYPKNYWVDLIFGGYRLFVFYFLAFIVLFLIERAILHKEKYRNSFLVKKRRDEQ